MMFRYFSLSACTKRRNLRRSMLMSGGDPSVLVTRPLSLAFIIATVLILVVMVVGRDGWR